MVSNEVDTASTIASITKGYIISLIACPSRNDEGTEACY